MVTGIASQATPQWRQQGSTWRPTASSSMSLPTRPCHFPASPSHSRFSGGLGPGPHVTPATLPPSPQESQPQGPVDAQDQSTRGAKLLPERRSASRRPPSRTVPCARPGLRAGRTSAPHPTFLEGVLLLRVRRGLGVLILVSVLESRHRFYRQACLLHRKESE